MRILLTGHKGQLGRALAPLLEAHRVQGVDLPEHDITDREGLIALARDVAPHLIIHTAAMTNVDACARDPQAAYRVNGMGTQNVALAAAAVGAEMLYVSTNEVFDGNAAHPQAREVAPTAEHLDCEMVYSEDEGVVGGEIFGPYHEWASCNPINPYGRSKLAGEWYTRHLLTRFYIVRTAWLYAKGGHNFPHTIIRLADEHGRLRVVTDEVGNPTYAPDLAAAIVALIETHAYGVYHLVNEGAASRYTFAREILRLSRRARVPVEPITTAEFDRESTPPPYAPLSNTAAAALGIRLRPWPEALRDFLAASGYRR
jgi:dTDP-4-dehydrorhamnose reductase